MQFSTSFIAAAAAFLPLIEAHMKMVSPLPYGGITDNSPLDPTGSNFPCKTAPGAYKAAGNAVTFTPGKAGKMVLQGQAVHGGGSCQISITYDDPPTAESVFKVVQSYEGACPIFTEGNLGDNASIDQPPFDVTLPTGLKAGPATFAWTWFNKIGNREMYMNCAPIIIGGSGKSDTVFKGLPDMLVANLDIPRSTCKVPPGVDLIFQNPGKNLIRSKEKCNFEASCGEPTGDSGRGDDSSSDGETGNDENDGSYTPPQDSSPVVTSAPFEPTGGYPGGVFVGITSAVDNEAPGSAYTPINSAPSTTLTAIAARPTGSYGNGGPTGGDMDDSTGGDMGDSYGAGNDSAPTGKTCDGSWIIKCDSPDARKFTLCYGKNQVTETFDCQTGMSCKDVEVSHPGNYGRKFKRTAREHLRRMAHKHKHRRF
jgi:hypothetical protein